MRSWLSALALSAGKGRYAAFETAFRWSPSGAKGAIWRGLQRAGYRPVAKAQPFIVTGGNGPLRAGEVDKARAWGAELARAMVHEQRGVAAADGQAEGVRRSNRFVPVNVSPGGLDRGGARELIDLRGVSSLEGLCFSQAALP
jgi:hypothetical protein